MKRHNIAAILLQEFYMVKESLEILVDVFVFSLINIVLFGFIANYLGQESGKIQAESLLIAVIFWEVIRITQYSTSTSSMWNVWSHNLSNIFIAPIRIAEYILAHIISASLKSIFVFASSIAIAQFLFHLNILSLGLFPILFSYFNMVIFATSLGLILVGAVFQFGKRIQALTWGIIYVIQPLCAVFFPVNVLPPLLQHLAYFFPVTYFFEWLRAIHSGTQYSSSRILAAFCFNVLYLVLSCYIFSRQLSAAKRSGQIVRNDL